MLFPLQMFYADNIYFANNGCQEVSFVEVCTLYDGKSNFPKKQHASNI